MDQIKDLNFSALKYINIFYYGRLFLFKLRMLKKRALDSKYRYFYILLSISIFLLISYFIYGEFLRDQSNDVFGAISSLFIWASILLFLLFVLALFRNSINYTFMPTFFKDNKSLRTIRASKNNKELLPPSSLGNDYIKLLHDYSFELSLEGKQMQVLQVRIDGEKLDGNFTIFIPSMHYVMVRTELQQNIKSPHFYLDNVLNGKSLLRSLRNSTMQLESVFPNYYELHHDIGSESDVRYMLPPDNMMELLGFNYPYDIEFYDNTVWIIAKGYCMSENDLRSQLQFASKINTMFE